MSIYVYLCRLRIIVITMLMLVYNVDVCVYSSRQLKLLVHEFMHSFMHLMCKKHSVCKTLGGWVCMWPKTLRVTRNTLRREHPSQSLSVAMATVDEQGFSETCRCPAHWCWPSSVEACQGACAGAAGAGEAVFEANTLCATSLCRYGMHEHVNAWE